MIVEIEMKQIKSFDGEDTGSFSAMVNNEQVEACNEVLRRKYPGEDFTKEKEGVLVVSDKPFKDAIRTRKSYCQDPIRKVFGMPVWKHHETHEESAKRRAYDFTKPFYWRFDLYE